MLTSLPAYSPHHNTNSAISIACIMTAAYVNTTLSERKNQLNISDTDKIFTCKSLKVFALI